MFEIKVSGMTCGGCVKSVTNALLKADPNAKVDVSLENQLIKIDTKEPLPKITDAIQGSGFDVLSAK